MHALCQLTTRNGQHVLQRTTCTRHQASRRQPASQCMARGKTAQTDSLRVSRLVKQTVSLPVIARVDSCNRLIHHSFSKEHKRCVHCSRITQSASRRPVAHAMHVAGCFYSARQATCVPLVSQARTQLHADDVGGAVAPEARRGQQRLHARSHALLLRCSVTSGKNNRRHTRHAERRQCKCNPFAAEPACKTVAQITGCCRATVRPAQRVCHLSCCNMQLLQIVIFHPCHNMLLATALPVPLRTLRHSCACYLAHLCRDCDHCGQPRHHL